MEDKVKRPPLSNAQLMTIISPSTFYAPSQEELAQVKADDHVKVCVTFDKENGVTGERFWILLYGVEGNMAQGIIDNDLQYTHQHGLSLGDSIEVKLDNIYEILTSCQAEQTSDDHSV